MKTSEMKGAALDWAVAKCEGEVDTFTERERLADAPCFYSIDWSQGGPIIEREHIGVYRSSGQWIAEWWPDNSGMARNPAQRFQHNRLTCGPTPLIAAMRCYVASKLGDEVDVPAELED